MVYKPGQSGSQRVGQPRTQDREISFTKALRAAICENKFSVVLPDGSTFSEIPRVKMADYMAEAMLTATFRLPTGVEMKMSPKEFMETYWQIVTRVDGPPLQSIDLTQREALLFDPKLATLDYAQDMEKIEKDAEME